MKGHPQNLRVIDLDINERFLSFFEYLKSQVDKDKNDRYTWIEKNRRFHANRYALSRRKPTFPFPGAADVWPPLTDMIIEQMKSLYLNLILLSAPPVTAIAMGEEEMDRTKDVETWFEYQINHGSPNFMREQHYYVDDTLAQGFGILKTFWQYETRTAPEVFELSRLKPELAQRVVHPNLPEDLASLYLSEKIFDSLAYEPQELGGEMHPSTLTLLESSYDLDFDDKTDEKAIRQILEWMRTGAKEPLIVKKRDTVIDAPATAAIMAENWIVPGSATDVEDSFHISHEMWLNGFQVQARTRDAKWNPAASEMLMDTGKGANDPRYARSGIQGLEAERQGLAYTQGEKYYVVESCTWFDYDQDGVDEKVVITWSPNAERPLRAYAYDRPSYKWPYHISEFERNKRGIYASRGIPERLQDIERELVVSKRAELNRKMISSALSLMVRSTSPLANQAIRWVPGEKLIVNDVDRDAKPLTFPDLSVIFQQDQNIWKVWAESSIGTPNFAIADPTSNLNEPRTAKEIGAIQSQSRSIGGIRTSIYREAMSGVFHELFDLWHMLGDERVWVSTTSSEALELNKEELQGAYSFVLGPLVGLDDPTLEAQKALARIQVLMQVVASGTLPPEVKVDLGRAVELWITKDDPRAARQILSRRSPEEMKQIEQQQSQTDNFQGMLLGMQQAQGGDAAKSMAGSGANGRGARPR